MKIKLTMVAITLIITLSLILASCSTTTTTTTTSTSTTSILTASSPTQTIPPTTTTAATTTAANWWDKFGTPQYGGTITYRLSSLGYQFDPYNSFPGAPWMMYMESLYWLNWTTDRNEYSFKTAFYPPEYWQGRLAESWEQTDPNTIIAHLRKGVTWQNKRPVNGREFTSEDVTYSYNRMAGTGDGFTEASPFYASRIVNIASITAPDKYTIVYKFKVPSHQNFNLISELSSQNYVFAKECVEQENNSLQDWKDAVGTGPWILSDYVANTSITYTKNPNYWGYDERYPANKLPYADETKELAIPDASTAIAALRTGKIDIMAELNWQQVGSIKQSNPEILTANIPNPGWSLELRVDTKPFTDIRVRKAMQLSFDLKTLAKGFYGGTVDGNPTGMINEYSAGYAYPYSEWPQSLKDEYAYNPTQAKQLLSDAGYPNGFDTDVVVASNVDTQLLQVFQSFLMDIGINMDINVMDPPSANAFIRAKKHDQMSINTIGGSIATPGQTLHFRYTNDPANNGNVSDPNYDALVDKYDATLSSDEAKQLCKEISQYDLEQHWDIQTFSYFNYNAYQPYLEGYSGEHFLGGRGGKDPGGFFTRFWIDQNAQQALGH